MPNIHPVIEDTWKQVLYSQFESDYFLNLKSRLLEDKKQFTIYPPGSQIFTAFNYTPFPQVKVVILGQDPYHGPGQANGLCFSVSPGIKKPPSLENIFKELNADLGIPIPQSGNLEKWARQGVLLLNASLTVRANSPNSHHDFGWHIFTDEVIRQLSIQKSGLVFLLWGKFAQSKENLIDTTRHHILKAAHPSPLSAYAGFLGCKHFSKTNQILRSLALPEIDWTIE